jgi:hypothetical protein
MLCPLGPVLSIRQKRTSQSALAQERLLHGVEWEGADMSDCVRRAYGGESNIRCTDVTFP